VLNRSHKDNRRPRKEEFHFFRENNLSAVPEAIVKSPRSKPADKNGSLQDSFLQRRSNELVIGFAGPIGCGIKAVINAAENQLREFGYVEIVRVKLSDYLELAIKEGKIDLVDLEDRMGSSNAFQRYRKLQHAGMTLRKRTENAAILAEYAVQTIVIDRKKRALAAGKSEESAADVPPRVAYLIDQIKRPEEVKLLRAVYRNLFYLVGVTRVFAKRKEWLIEDGVKDGELEELMEIDRNENSHDGQRLDKTLHLANYFLPSDSADLQAKRKNIDRFLGLVHGDRSITPTSAERGMFAAFSAGLSSACMSRQVGAAILNTEGEILSTGCNDVPKAGGGLYTASSGEADQRCVRRPEQHCFNDFHKRELQKEIGVELEKFLTKLECEGKPLIVPQEKKKALLDSIYDNTRLGSLIEFSRAVHAEMDALVSLARNGGSGIRNANLFTTTFPCHNCARHIVAAGIANVIYIEPYEKSMAQALHEDSITFEHSSESKELDKAVRFVHFEGVSPQQYGRFFKVQTRKDKEGKFIPIAPQTADKSIAEYLDNYKDFEKKAVEHFNLDIAKLTTKLNIDNVTKL